MNNPNQLNGKWELRDEAGNLVGFCLSATQWQSLQDMQERLQSLAAENEKLREELRDVKYERDIYLRNLYELIPREPFSFTPQELEDMEKNGLTMEQILKEIREELGK